MGHHRSKSSLHIGSLNQFNIWMGFPPSVPDAMFLGAESAVKVGMVPRTPALEGIERVVTDDHFLSETLQQGTTKLQKSSIVGSVVKVQLSKSKRAFSCGRCHSTLIPSQGNNPAAAPAPDVHSLSSTCSEPPCLRSRALRRCRSSSSAHPAFRHRRSRRGRTISWET